MQMEQVNTVKNDGTKSDENDEDFLYFNSFWLGFQIYLVKTLKLICQAPVRLIDKRGLICDHSQSFVYFWENIVVYFDRDRFSEF